MSEPQLRALFAETAHDEPPPSRVDAELARRRGSARLRWRRACMAGTPVLAAAAAVAVTLAVGALPFRPGVNPATRPAAPRQFNPLVPYLSFGWLPAGESLVSGGTGLAVMYLTAASKPNSDAHWDLAVYAAGQCELAAKRLTCSAIADKASFAGRLERITGRAPAVHGHRAFWSGTSLAWQYARGGWALLTLPYPFDYLRLPTTVKPGTNRATINRDAVDIASHVQFAAATPLVFPAQLTGLPSQWQVSGTGYMPYGSVLRVTTYALIADPAAGALDFDGGLTFQDNLPWIEINPVTVRHNFCYSYPKEMNKDGERSIRQTMNGYRVIVNYQDIRAHAIPGLSPSHPFHSQALCAASVSGLAVSISENGAHPLIGVASLFKNHLRLLGTNPANWTHKPIG